MTSTLLLSKRTLVAGAAGAVGAMLAPELRALAQSSSGYPRLLLGPMLGAPRADGLPIWAMASGPHAVAVEYADNPGLDDARRTAPVTAAAADAYIVRPDLSGLRPGSRYWYRMVVEGQTVRPQEPPGAFRTAPSVGTQEVVSVGFGSCASYNHDPVQPIWNAVAERAPDLFVNLGDNIYADALQPHVFDFEYQRQRGVPNYQRVARDIPQLAIWDNHDFSALDRSNPLRDAALAAFKRYWANPGYGLRDAPGVFFRLSYGAVDLFCTDGRYHRDPNIADDVPGKTMLGARQKAWLKDELKQSRAVFKVLACGSGWSKNKGPGGDAWSSFLHEREEIFDFIRDENVSGVILISGDTHIAELNCIPWSERGGYDLFDFVSSPLAQLPSQSWLRRSPDIRLRTPYTSGSNFGLLRFEFAGEPTVKADIVDPAARLVWPTVELRASQLRNGVSSWRQYKDA